VAFWFTPPNKPLRHPPSNIKMSIVTLLGVYPLSMLIPALVNPLTHGWPLWLQGLIIATLIVSKSDLGGDARPHEIIREMAVRLKLRRKNGGPCNRAAFCEKFYVSIIKRRYPWQNPKSKLSEKDC